MGTEAWEGGGPEAGTACHGELDGGEGQAQGDVPVTAVRPRVGHGTVWCEMWQRCALGARRGGAGEVGGGGNIV